MASREPSAPAEAAGHRRRRRSRTPRARQSATTVSTRIQILKCAAAAFRRLGYHGASVEAIASALRMKKGNLYYYFRNKEDILFACHQYSVDRLLSVLETVERSEAPPEHKLRQLIVAVVHTIIDDLQGTALFLDIKALGP